jgi:hypothetical protein
MIIIVEITMTVMSGMNPTPSHVVTAPETWMSMKDKSISSVSWKRFATDNKATKPPANTGGFFTA